MDIVKILDKSISTCTAIYHFINKVKNLQYEYSQLANDMLIIMELFFEIKNSRLIILQNDNINDTIQNIAENLDTLSTQLLQSQQNNLKKKIKKVLFNDVNEKKEKLIVLTRRLKLLLDISKEKKSNSRLDIMNILKDKDLILFWDKHFGSENNTVPFELFLQSLEDEFQRKFKKEEAEFIRDIIDMDSNRNVSIYEFNLWIRRFGPFTEILKNSFMGIYDFSRERKYEWYFGDTFKENIEQFLYDKGFGTIIIRNNFLQLNSGDNILFYLCFVGWSLRKDESTVLQIPIVKNGEKLFLQLEKIERISPIFEEAKYFKNLLLDEIGNKQMEFYYLEEIYKNFSEYLKEFGNNNGLIYYSHFENKSYRNIILGEIINILNKINFKWKKIIHNYDDIGEKKESRFNFCGAR